MFEQEYRVMSSVPRWSVARTIRTQSVAEHSYYVTLYAQQLCLALGYNQEFTAKCLLAALYHDVPEIVSGDIPAPFKRNTADRDKIEGIEGTLGMVLPEFYYAKAEALTLEPKVKFILKVADSIDEMFFLADEVSRGNKSLHKLLGDKIEQFNYHWGTLPFSDKEQNVKMAIIQSVLRMTNTPDRILNLDGSIS